MVGPGGLWVQGAAGEHGKAIQKKWVWQGVCVGVCGGGGTSPAALVPAAYCRASKTTRYSRGAPFLATKGGT